MAQILEREISARSALAPEAPGMGRGGASDNVGGGVQPLRRTPAEYQVLWQEFFEAARAAGRATNTARAIANERLTRQRAEDEGRELLGRGDIETYF